MSHEQEIKRIEELVVSLSSDPFSPELNFYLAEEYAKIEQYASAISFYLRCAEYGYGSHPLYVYTALLKVSHSFNKQGGRITTVTNSLLQAIDYLPSRPEAYFFMSQLCERQGNWSECHAWASIGLFVADLKELELLPSKTDYYGRYCLEFEKGISAWWIGQIQESSIILEKLSTMDLAPEYKATVKYNLDMLKGN